MTTAEKFAYIERGMIAGTLAMPIMRELLKRLASDWFATSHNEKGVPSGVYEIRTKLDVKGIQMEETR
jgi:hypothetical protein